MVDFTILVLLFVIIHVFCKVGNINSKVELWICIICLMCLSAFRGSTIGNDTHEYIRIFQACQKGIIDVASSRYEIGYLKFNEILGKISNNYQILFIVTSLFIFYSFGRFIIKYSEDVWLSVYMLLTYGFFSFSFTAIRQGLALAILLFAFDYVISGKKIKFLLCVLIASLFHNTAALFIFAYMVRYVRPSLRIFLLFGLIGIVGLVVFQTLLSFAFRYFTMYQHYESGSYVGDAGIANMLYIVISSLILGYSYIILSKGEYRSRLKVNQCQVDNYSMILVLFGIVFYILSLKANIMDRIGLYYNIFSIILLPNAIKMLRTDSKIIVIPIIIFAFYMYTMIILIYRPGWNSVFPYSFYW